MAQTPPSADQIKTLAEQLKRDARSGGYFINPDEEFVNDLVKGLLENEGRYGYQACPCRLASGEKAADLDIVCPCDYRDPDLVQYGTCFCALYVNEAVFKGEKKLQYVPDRRLSALKNRKTVVDIAEKKPFELKYPVLRCTVCGYLCARNEPPEICPICKAKKDRFERFI